MSHLNPSLLTAYNSLTDKHLTAYFNNARIRRHLLKVGLITRSGRIVPDKEYKHKLIQRAHQRHVRECLAQAIFHKVLDMERLHQNEIKRKLEEFARRERIYKIKADRSKRFEDEPMILLSPRPPTGPKISHAQHSGPDAEHSESTDSPSSSRPNTAPGKMQRPIRLKPLKSSSAAVSLKRSSPRHRAREPDSSNDTDQHLSYTLDRDTRKHLTMADFSCAVSPYRLPVINNYVTPVPPLTKKKERGPRANGTVRGRRFRPTTAPTAALEPSPLQRTSSQSKVLVSMMYFGKSVHLSHDLMDLRDEVKVFQQHCGGENLCVYKGKLKEGEVFQFVSRRHQGFPFSLTFFLNGLQVDRLSSCCEFKHRKCSRLGGRHGHFGFCGVEGASPCYKCIIAMGMDKKPSPPQKRVKDEEPTSRSPDAKETTDEETQSNAEPSTPQEMEIDANGETARKKKTKEEYEEDFEADDEGPVEDGDEIEEKTCANEDELGPENRDENDRGQMEIKEEKSISDSDDDANLSKGKKSSSVSSGGTSSLSSSDSEHSEGEIVVDTKEEVANDVPDDDVDAGEEVQQVEAEVRESSDDILPEIAAEDSGTQDSPMDGLEKSDLEMSEDTDKQDGTQVEQIGEDANTEGQPQESESERAKSMQEMLAEAILKESQCSSEPEFSDTSTEEDEGATTQQDSQGVILEENESNMSQDDIKMEQSSEEKDDHGSQVLADERIHETQEGNMEEMQIGEQMEKDPINEQKGADVPKLQEDGTDGGVPKMEIEGTDVNVVNIEEEGTDADVPKMEEESTDGDVSKMEKDGTDVNVVNIEEEGTDADVPKMEEESTDGDVSKMVEEGTDVNVPNMEDESTVYNVPKMQEEGTDDDVPKLETEDTDDDPKLEKDGTDDDPSLEKEDTDADVVMLEEEGTDANVLKMVEESTDADVPKLEVEGTKMHVPKMEEGTNADEEGGIVSQIENDIETGEGETETQQENNNVDQNLERQSNGQPDGDESEDLADASKDGSTRDMLQETDGEVDDLVQKAEVCEENDVREKEVGEMVEVEDRSEVIGIEEAVIPTEGKENEEEACDSHVESGEKVKAKKTGVGGLEVEDRSDALERDEAEELENEQIKAGENELDDDNVSMPEDENGPLMQKLEIVVDNEMEDREQENVVNTVMESEKEMFKVEQVSGVEDMNGDIMTDEQQVTFGENVFATGETLLEELGEKRLVEDQNVDEIAEGKDGHSVENEMEGGKTNNEMGTRETLGEDSEKGRFQTEDGSSEKEDTLVDTLAEGKDKERLSENDFDIRETLVDEPEKDVDVKEIRDNALEEGNRAEKTVDDILNVQREETAVHGENERVSSTTSNGNVEHSGKEEESKPGGVSSDFLDSNLDAENGDKQDTNLEELEEVEDGLYIEEEKDFHETTEEMIGTNCSGTLLSGENGSDCQKAGQEDDKESETSATTFIENVPQVLQEDVVREAESLSGSRGAEITIDEIEQNSLKEMDDDDSAQNLDKKRNSIIDEAASSVAYSVKSHNVKIKRESNVSEDLLVHPAKSGGVDLVSNWINIHQESKYFQTFIDPLDEEAVITEENEDMVKNEILDDPDSGGLVEVFKDADTPSNTEIEICRSGDETTTPVKDIFEDNADSIVDSLKTEMKVEPNQVNILRNPSKESIHTSVKDDPVQEPGNTIGSLVTKWSGQSNDDFLQNDVAGLEESTLVDIINLEKAVTSNDVPLPINDGMNEEELESNQPRTTLSGQTEKESKSDHLEHFKDNSKLEEELSEFIEPQSPNINNSSITYKSENGSQDGSASIDLQSRQLDGERKVIHFQQTLSRESLSTFTLEESSFFGPAGYPRLATAQTENSY